MLCDTQIYHEFSTMKTVSLSVRTLRLKGLNTLIILQLQSVSQYKY